MLTFWKDSMLFDHCLPLLQEGHVDDISYAVSVMTTVMTVIMMVPNDDIHDEKYLESKMRIDEYGKDSGVEDRDDN